MADILITPDDSDPTGGGENKKLQNNSEESTKPENAETNNGSGRKHYRKDNTRIANLKNTKSQKQKKLARLISERDSKKADRDRGYINVPLNGDSDTQRVKQVQLDPSDKEMLRSVIAEREYEIYELGLDIDELELKIKSLATAKKSSFKNKLSKKKQDKNENDMIKKIDSALDKASKNGSKEIVYQIQKDAQAGNKGDAYKSLKSFLSKNVKTVSRKLSKSVEMEQKVLDRVLDKFTPFQS